jgi:hypothetical protein
MTRKTPRRASKTGAAFFFKKIGQGGFWFLGLPHKRFNAPFHLHHFNLTQRAARV